jgi:hypothetical protein
VPSVEDRDPIISTIAFHVIPSLRDVRHKVGALTVLAWSQLLISILVVGLLALVLVRVI